MRFSLSFSSHSRTHESDIFAVCGERDYNVAVMTAMTVIITT